MEFTDEAIQALKSHRWPGNVRELENLIERLAILWEGGPIGYSQIVQYMTQPAVAEGVPGSVSQDLPSHGVDDSLQEVEKRRLIRALEKNNWIQTRAAKELGISLRQIGYKIRNHRLDDMVRTGRNAVGSRRIQSTSSIESLLGSD
ncbi:helix-turn-helix domain-containing protein [Thermodesulfobacteriota bacterium]